jgi:hypothetical protein
MPPQGIPPPHPPRRRQRIEHPVQRDPHPRQRPALERREHRPQRLEIPHRERVDQIRSRRRRDLHEAQRPEVERRLDVQPDHLLAEQLLAHGTQRRRRVDPLDGVSRHRRRPLS